MEQLIFGTANLVFFALFLAAIAAPILAAYYIGKKFKLIAARWLFPCVAVAVPIFWAYASNAQYKKVCAASIAPQFFSKPALKQNGYAIEQEPIGLFVVSSFDPEISYRFDDFSFIQIGANIRHKKNSNGTKQADLAENAREAAYIVKTLAWKRLELWWKPPIYIAEFHVEEIRTKKVIARASELVFGGGLTSMFMRLLGGDQDYEFRGCGYVSKEIGLYRPTLSTRAQRMSAYQNVDQDFVTRALTPD